jgi:hypothetical protein
MRTVSAVVMVGLLGAGAATVALGQTRTTPPPKQSIDPQAVAALERMGAYLRSQQTMRVEGEMTTDDVLPSGQKVQYSGTVQLRVRRPDRLRADVISDRKNEQMFYDGKTFTVFQPRVGYYASFDAPPTLGELVDVAEKRYGLDLPLADLFYWGTEKSPVNELRAATKVGGSTVKGVACEHYAFRQRDVDWEICIEPGGRPLPRKMIITTTTEPTRPQHSMVLTWDLAPRLDDTDFAFTPPPTAQRIQFETAAPEAPTRQGRSSASKRGVSP